MREIEVATFSGQGRRGGGSWAQLDDKYAERKNLEGRGNKILVLTDRLRRSLTVPGSRDALVEYLPASILFGTRVPYAGPIDTGTRKMPARPFIDFTYYDLIRFEKILRDHIMSSYRHHTTAAI